MVSLKAVGVTPEYARAMAAAGFRNLDENDLTQAKSIGLSPDYVRGMVGAGLPPDIDDLVQLRAVGVPVQYVASVRKSGHRVDADKIVEMWAVGVKPGDMQFVPAPPKTPRPPRKITVQPDWDPDG